MGSGASKSSSDAKAALSPLAASIAAQTGITLNVSPGTRPAPIHSTSSSRFSSVEAREGTMAEVKPFPKTVEAHLKDLGLQDQVLDITKVQHHNAGFSTSFSPAAIDHVSRTSVSAHPNPTAPPKPSPDQSVFIRGVRPHAATIMVQPERAERSHSDIDSGPCTLTSSSTTGDHEFTREGVGGSQDTSAVSALNKAIEVINQDGSTTEEYCAIKLSEREDGVTISLVERSSTTQIMDGALKEPDDSRIAPPAKNPPVQLTSGNDFSERNKRTQGFLSQEAVAKTSPQSTHATAADVLRSTTVDDCLDAAMSYFQGGVEKSLRPIASLRPTTCGDSNWFAQVAQVLSSDADVLLSSTQQRQSSYMQRPTPGSPHDVSAPVHSKGEIYISEKESLLTQQLRQIHLQIGVNKIKEDEARQQAAAAGKLQGTKATTALTWWLDQQDYMQAKQQLEADRLRVQKELLELRHNIGSKEQRESKHAAQAMQMAKDWLVLNESIDLEELDSQINRLQAEQEEEQRREAELVHGVCGAAREWLRKHAVEEEAHKKGTYKTPPGFATKEEPHVAAQDAKKLASDIELERDKRAKNEERERQTAELRIQQAAMDAQQAAAMREAKVEAKIAAEHMLELDRRREARKAIEMLAEVAHTHNDDAARLEVENLTRIEQANQDEWDREQSSRQDAAQNHVDLAVVKKQEAAMLLARKEALRRKRADREEKNNRRDEDKAKYMADERSRRIALQKQHIRGSRMLRVLGGLV